MVRFSTPIHAAQLPKEENYSALPAGKYIASIVKAEIKTTKAGDGQYLNIQFKIVDGEHKGRSFFDIVNFNNPNPIATEIGLKRLNTILTIGGIATLEDTEQLKNITALVTLSISEYNGNEKNEVVKLESPNSSAQQQPQQQSYAMQQPVNTQPQQQWQQPPVAQPAQQQSWGHTAQPQQQQWQQSQGNAPTIQQSQQQIGQIELDDEIPF